MIAEAKIIHLTMRDNNNIDVQQPYCECLRGLSALRTVSYVCSTIFYELDPLVSLGDYDLNLLTILDFISRNPGQWQIGHFTVVHLTEILISTPACVYMYIVGATELFGHDLRFKI